MAPIERTVRIGFYTWKLVPSNSTYGMKTYPIDLVVSCGGVPEIVQWVSSRVDSSNNKESQ